MTDPAPASPDDAGPAPARDDPRPLLLRALDQAGSLVAGTAPEHAARPTPCPGWDVATLVGHLCAVARRVAVLGAGGDGLSVPSLRPDLGPADGAAEFAAGAAEARAAWADDASLDRTVRAPFGTVPGRVAARSYTQELTTHSWDLAVATGRTDRLDPELAAAVLSLAERLLPAGRRGGPVPFGPVVEVPADADPYARLAGWTGRSPVALPR